MGPKLGQLLHITASFHSYISNSYQKNYVNIKLNHVSPGKNELIQRNTRHSNKSSPFIITSRLSKRVDLKFSVFGTPSGPRKSSAVTSAASEFNRKLNSSEMLEVHTQRGEHSTCFVQEAKRRSTIRHRQCRQRQFSNANSLPRFLNCELVGQ